MDTTEPLISMKRFVIPCDEAFCCMHLSEMEKNMTVGFAAKPITPHWTQALFPNYFCIYSIFPTRSRMLNDEDEEAKHLEPKLA